MGADEEGPPPLVKRWSTVYLLVLVSLAVSVGLLYGLGRFGR